jgi:predicted RNA-binding protein with PIN domain
VLEVARRGEAAAPRISAPAPLRPLLRFSSERLTATALASIRRVVEADDELRARALDAAEEDGSPRASWIFLQRPEGWEAELDAIAAEREAEVGASRTESDERSARRRVKVLEDALRKAESQLTAARAEAAEGATALSVERKSRRAADEQLAALQRKVASLEGERDSARRRADEAAAASEALRLELAESRASAGALDVRRRALEAEIEAVSAAVTDARPDVAEPPFDPRPVGGAVAEAAAAARRLADSLAQAAAALGADAPFDAARPLPDESHRIDVDSVTKGSSASAEGRGRAGGDRRPRRQPATLPPAVLDDSREAAAHLMRVGGAILLVDGYNATLSTWPDLPIAEQRHRLVDALAELSARTGVEPTVVFDGDEQVVSRPGQPRRPVRVRFSGPGVEADDVIIDLVAELPIHRPVIVASDDRRVRIGAAERGANVISNDQLFAAMGRER